MEKVAFFFLGVLFFTTMCGTDTIKDFYKLVFFFSVFLNEPENIVFSKNRKFKFDFYKWTGWKRVILSQVM